MPSACPACHADTRRVAAGWYICDACGTESINPHAGPQAAAAFSRQCEEMFKDEIEYKRSLSKKQFGGTKKSGRTRKKEAKKGKWFDTGEMARRLDRKLRRKAK